MNPVTFTIDLEDPTEAYAPDGRALPMVDRLLDIADAVDAKATFFTVGLMAKTYPALIKKIAANGHEIAYHSHAHRPLTKDTAENFRTTSKNDKDLIEQLTGQPLLGFRAPCYSLTPATLWATEVLKENGFVYSSSIMPTKISRYGFSNVPAHAFRWPSGLIEFPMPIKSFGSIGIPYLGGIYMYALPSWIGALWQKSASADEVLWTYAHPYDLDKEEPFKPMPKTPLWVSLILWSARRVSENKLRKTLARGTAAPLGARALSGSFTPIRSEP